ncbi:hypothetical protein QYE76_037594 [Lolium multiflorum]|uniref:Uncharacterized protein n=1 Tax=Lolium multiflorum TaxID=4521 RepID=A0AAD8VBR8_LOLMU|nr:hypothetical protein QYE76_037594 [Lolium multiflorum]
MTGNHGPLHPSTWRWRQQPSGMLRDSPCAREADQPAAKIAWQSLVAAALVAMCLSTAVRSAAALPPHHRIPPPVRVMWQRPPPPDPPSTVAAPERPRLRAKGSPWTRHHRPCLWQPGAAAPPPTFRWRQRPESGGKRKSAAAHRIWVDGHRLDSRLAADPSLGDISSVVRTRSPDDFGLRFSTVEAEGCTKAGAIILNTFDDLSGPTSSGDALGAEYRACTLSARSETNSGTTMPHQRGQLQFLQQRRASGNRTPSASLGWTHKKSTVVYANFGSLSRSSQLSSSPRFAWGLAATGHPFLWSIRDNLVSGASDSLAVLPPEFVAATAEAVLSDA